MATITVKKIVLTQTHTLHMDIIDGKVQGLGKSSEGHVPEVTETVIGIDDRLVTIRGHASLVEIESDLFDDLAENGDCTYTIDDIELLPGTVIQRHKNLGTGFTVEILMSVFSDFDGFDDVQGTAYIQVDPEFEKLLYKG